MGLKRVIVGTIITVIIGGTTYKINKTDVANNFASDTGVSQQQAQQYVNGVSDKDLVPYDELGSEYITDGQKILSTAAQIDCLNYTYEWESAELPCDTGKTQLNETGNDEISLGLSYKALSTSSASKDDISTAIKNISELNSDFEFEIVGKVLSPSAITDIKNANSYNKAVLQTAFDKD